MKKLLVVLLAIAAVVLLVCGFGIRTYEQWKDGDTAILRVQGYENPVVIQLRPDVAPITVENFKTLAKDGFYDGLTFHRVINGFMIQGGDPKGDGTGGSPNKIMGEFTANGVNNPLKHTRGVVSMARGNQMNSASSQFFIVHKDRPHLNGQYAAFGEVISGMDVVDRIALLETDSNDKPTVDVIIQQVSVPDAERIWTVNMILLGAGVLCLAGAVILTVLVVKAEKAAQAAAAAAAAARRHSHKNKRR